MALQFGFGSGVLYGIRTDVANATPLKFGVLQDISIDFNGEIKELFGQLQYPVDVARGKTKIEGKAKFAQISGPEFNNLFFGQSIQTGGQKLPVFSEAQNIASVNTVSLATSSSTAIGSTVISMASVAGIQLGDGVTGSTSIPAGAYVTAITGNQVTISAATITAAITSGTVLTFAGDVYQTATATASGSTTIVMSSVVGLYVGMVLTGVTGVTTGATITAINTATNTITISAATTAIIAANTSILFQVLLLTTATTATTSGSPVLTFTSTAGAAVGQVVGTGVPGIPAGSTIVSLTATTITMSANATASIPIGTTIPITPVPAINPNFGGTGVFDTDLGPVYSATGVPFTYVALTQPTAQGTYTVNPTTGQYVFSPLDGSSAVLLNYTYLSALTGFKVTGNNLLMGTTPRFEAVFTQTYNGNNLVLKLFQCVSSKLTMPTKIDDYVINEVDFMAFANAAGVVFELSTTS